ncbi:hypothetical protein HIM_02594 [Hirsutella minnesotensis 3608]|nr:hypothetical protein HIM_02594 [Hirsutella minnesotensis 3608]
MAEIARVAARNVPAFKFGTKQVFLPNHVITFLRKEHLPPNEASFQVPLRFTKFDLRDYLWNLYGVEAKKVRVYVKEQPLMRRAKDQQSFYRPRSLKIMTVELAKPFQWPEVPENTEPWSRDLWQQREKAAYEAEEDGYNKNRGTIPLVSEKPLSQERKELASLARQMLSGEVKWTNGVTLDPKWDKLLPKDKKSEVETKKGQEARP